MGDKLTTGVGADMGPLPPCDSPRCGEGWLACKPQTHLGTSTPLGPQTWGWDEFQAQTSDLSHFSDKVTETQRGRRLAGGLVWTGLLGVTFTWRKRSHLPGLPASTYPSGQILGHPLRCGCPPLALPSPTPDSLGVAEARLPLNSGAGCVH